jgi:hypothetical protein
MDPRVVLSILTASLLAPAGLILYAQTMAPKPVPAPPVTGSVRQTIRHYVNGDRAMLSGHQAAGL